MDNSEDPFENGGFVGHFVENVFLLSNVQYLA